MNYEIIDHKQGSSEWLSWRKTLIMASEIPILLGISPYMTPFQLFNEKMGSSEAQKENKNMIFGKEKEEFIRNESENEYGYHFSPIVAKSLKYPWLGCSLDGWDEEENMILEAKANNKINHEIAMKGKVPDIHWPQIQTQMLVMDTPMMLYTSYWMDELAFVIAVRNEEACQNIIKTSKEFYDAMLNFTPPPMTDKDYIVRKDEEWELLCIKLKYAQDNLKAWEKYEKETKESIIKLANGQSSVGYGIRLSKIFIKGRIDYDSIPELNSVDLEKYRKGTIETWRITKCDS